MTETNLGSYHILLSNDILLGKGMWMKLLKKKKWQKKCQLWRGNGATEEEIQTITYVCKDEDNF